MITATALLDPKKILSTSVTGGFTPILSPVDFTGVIDSVPLIDSSTGVITTTPTLSSSTGVLTTSKTTDPASGLPVSTVKAVEEATTKVTEAKPAVETETGIVETVRETTNTITKEVAEPKNPYTWLLVVAAIVGGISLFYLFKP